MTQGERIQEIMNDLNMTQREFAKELGISTSSMNRLVNDGQELKDYIKKIFVHKFNVNPVWLDTGEGSKYQSFTLSEGLNTILAEFPAVRRALEVASEKMTLEDWKKLDDFIESLGGKE